MIRVILILIFSLLITLSCFAQNRIDFEGVFQKAYKSIDSDSVLCVKQCSTFGRNMAVICWKLNGEYHFKKIEEKRRRIKTTCQINNKLKKHFISFYALQVSKESKECKPYLIDDGGYTFVEFKANYKILSFIHPSYEGGDESVKTWTQKTVSLLRKKK